MVSLDCTVSRHDGVTLVVARVREIAEPTRVRVENRLDGPVWPPRSEGLPEAGWTDSGFTGVLGPSSGALGYATPAPPSEPAAELVDVTPAPDAAPSETITESPAAVVRRLGDPSPPSDAVPTAAETGRRDGERATRTDIGAIERNRKGGSEQADSDEPTAELPDALGPWLAEMARRVDHAESLAAAETVPEAAAAVRETGGLARVRELDDDERELRVVARRVRRLAERRAAADVPVETLAALA